MFQCTLLFSEPAGHWPMKMSLPYVAICDASGRNLQILKASLSLQPIQEKARKGFPPRLKPHAMEGTTF